MADKRPEADSQSPTLASHGETRWFVPEQKLGDFDLLREIGRGGMGVVYEARQRSLNRRVALKILPPGLGLSRHAVDRFEREARAAAKLHHTNIVPVHAIGEEAGCHYYAMDLIEGRSLAQVLDDLSGGKSNALFEQTVTRASAELQPKDVDTEAPKSSSSSLTDTGSGRTWFDTVAKLVAEVADALQYAHDKGIIHRDIKPGNLMLSEEGRLCITDFGLARMTMEPGMTVSGSLMGSPAYMSPEQVAAGRTKLDHRTDVYSLGSVLYEVLTLQRPFRGESREELLTAILTKEPRAPRRANPRVPVDLETICLKAMEKDPDRRYGTAAEMAADLRQFLQRGLIAARRAGPIRRSAKAIRRHPVVAVSVSAAILLVVVGGFAWQALQRGEDLELQRMLSEARHSLSQGEYRESLRKADLALSRDASRTEARVIRARSLIRLRRGSEALVEAQQMLEQNPDDWVAHAIVVASAEMGGGFYGGDPEPHVEAVERLAPETAEAFTLRAAISDSSREAIELLDRALEIDPGYAAALESRAFRRMNLKDFPAALDDAERLMAARPRSATGRGIRAGCFFQLHDLDSAGEEIERALQLDPDDPMNYWQRAWWHVNRGEIEKAIADGGRAIEMDPGNAWMLRTRASFFSNIGRYDEAMADIERAIELEPTNPEAYQTLADIHRLQGDREKASSLLEQLEERLEQFTDPETLSGIHQSRAWAFSRLGEHERALAEAQKAVAADPEEFWAYLARAGMRQQLEGESGRIEDCSKAASIEVEELNELLWRANALRNRCHLNDLALRDFNRLIELAPHWPEPYRLRGLLHQEEKRLEQAVADFDKVVELAPSWKQAWYNKGAILSDLDRFAEAAEAYARAQALGNLEAAYPRALALISLRRGDEALEILDQIIEKIPTASHYYLYRSFASYSVGRVDEALEFVEKAIELDPERSWQSYALRAEYAMTNDLRSCDENAADLEKCLELRPGNPFAAAAVALVAAAHLSRLCPERYDEERYLEIARTAAAYDTQNATHQYYLGSVLYRNGRYDEAREALERALELSVRPFPYMLQFLAMTHARLGNEVEARAYFDQAAERIEKTAPNHAGYNHFQQEAAQVLGLEERGQVSF